MTYYLTFVLLVLVARHLTEKFLVAKKWEGLPGYVARAWVIYFCVSVNDLYWFWLEGVT